MNQPYNRFAKIISMVHTLKSKCNIFNQTQKKMKLLKEGRMKKFIRKHKHEIGKGLTFFSEKELKDTQTAEILCTS